MGDWSNLEPLFDHLAVRPIDTVEQLEQWLLDISELSACISEEATGRYVAMMRQTDDEQKEKAYVCFIEQIEPTCKLRWHELNQRYVSAPCRSDLPLSRYGVYDRNTAASVDLFCEANIPLQAEDAKLAQQYSKVCGAMTVQYDGREHTLEQMSRYGQEPDRKVRQESWELVVARRLQDRGQLEDVFEQMLALRTQIARNAGFESYCDYQFTKYNRFDYTPQDCFALHHAIERLAVPAMRAIQARRRETLAVDTLRPWDLAVDPKSRPPLRPFHTGDELCRKCQAVFTRVNPELGSQFAELWKGGWLDLESRKGKAPGAFLEPFFESRYPFIFMNVTGLHDDVESLLHEGGHAMHDLACRDEPLMQYRDYPLEIAEVASMGMELLARDHLDVFYSGEDLERARRQQAENIISLFISVAILDAFQHWLYAEPGHDRAERAKRWLTLLDRFGGVEDYSGYESAREASWQRIRHLFKSPFYYIEYGIAQIGALQLWQNARADAEQAIRQYREALALGGSKPLPELWATAGLTFDFSEATLRPLIGHVLKELGLALPGL